MPAKRRAFPDKPDVPASFDPAPPTLGSHDVWEEIEADGAVEVAECVADAELRASIWTRAQLLGRRFTGLTCQDMRFVQCDFAGASLEDARLSRVTFESCRMTGAIFGGATLQDVHLVECAADLADFRMAHWRRSAAERSSLRDADFYGSDFTDVRLADCDLTTANFEAATQDGLELGGSTLDRIRGAPSLAGAQIDIGQILSLGAALVSALGFRVK